MAVEGAVPINDGKPNLALQATLRQLSLRVTVPLRKQPFLPPSAINILDSFPSYGRQLRYQKGIAMNASLFIPQQSYARHILIFAAVLVGATGAVAQTYT